MIVAGADDIVAMLEESQVTVGTIRGSRYVGPIKVTIQLTAGRTAGVSQSCVALLLRDTA